MHLSSREGGYGNSVEGGRWKVVNACSAKAIGHIVLSSRFAYFDILRHFFGKEDHFSNLLAKLRREGSRGRAGTGGTPS